MRRVVGGLCRGAAAVGVCAVLASCQSSPRAGDATTVPGASPGPSSALPQTPTALRDAVTRLTRAAAAAPAGDTAAQARRAAACAELAALAGHVVDPDVAERVLISSFSDLTLSRAARECPDSPASTVSALESVSRDLSGGNLPPG